REEPQVQTFGSCAWLRSHWCEATICGIMTERLSVRIPPRRSDTHAPKCVGWSGVAGALGSRGAQPFVTGSGCGRKSAAPLLTLHRMFVKNLVLNQSSNTVFWVRVLYVCEDVTV